jgi:hypothetical protein
MEKRRRIDLETGGGSGGISISYSYRIDSTGFRDAALNVCQPTVKRATIIENSPARPKNHQ